MLYGQTLNPTARRHTMSVKLLCLSMDSILSPSNPNDLGADVRAYVAGRRDSKQESNLLGRIRALPQHERRALLLPLLELKAFGVLALIHRAQLSRDDYLEIFKQGLTKGDASSIALWMDATVAHIGWRKALSVLREALTTNPRGGAFALYHVPLVARALCIRRREGQLSGTLPTAELAVEYVRLVVRYHENGHRVVDDKTLDRLKKTLSSHKQ